MPETITILVNNAPISIQPGTTVAAAVLQAGYTTFRTSVTGQSRGPLCGMGICFECALTINGEPHTRSCQILCDDGMEVHTDDTTR